MKPKSHEHILKNPRLLPMLGHIYVQYQMNEVCSLKYVVHPYLNTLQVTDPETSPV